MTLAILTTTRITSRMSMRTSSLRAIFSSSVVLRHWFKNGSAVLEVVKEQGNSTDFGIAVNAGK